jgi:kynurenine formamidase
MMALPRMRLLIVSALTMGLLIVTASAQTKSPDGLLERAFTGKARVIDLSHKLNASVPTFDGERDAWRYEKLSEIAPDGYASGAFRVPEHFGTHVDSPGHFINGKETIDRIDVQRFIVPAVVIDVRAQASSNADYQLTVADLKQWERGGQIPAGAAVLLLTGWAARWDDVNKYRTPDTAGVMHFPGYSVEAIRYLLNRKVVALGIDTLSIDYGPSKDFAGHKLSHASGLYHMENLTNLDRLPARGAAIFVGALPIENGSGSPARVLAITP